MKILGVIPARFASTRFPGKPLVDIAGKTMVQRVYEQVKKATLITEVVVATDDARILEHVEGFGGKAVLTSVDHPSGTDRCFEAYQKLNEDFNYVINVQGDEPFIKPEQIDLLAALLNGDTFIATLVKEFKDQESLFNPNVVKAVINVKKKALYFSRSPIPHARNIEEEAWLSQHKYYKHIGMYAYRTDVLEELTKLPVSALEKTESLEQLRWLDNGYEILTAETKSETIGIDTPEDLQKALAYLKENPE
ncbi:3-deoxy-manno-octulosonate cytidylyltransferase [Chryseotalea sanaruensis]|uniref:3-deoxy-manno-octulosonate cytidylyltransferase n=1 Tax=Chryseotalea sanaruensis TaxID=2482724 RepID=A0A401U9A1_9BACT|nr:3-deoxy-manno-octulosonate cytidylyltransferase [Chryseotalea sanaruensis]GCC51460.1 3-deoxy-manno-octulosonate cytidylyltransferase [Chryseotalea sanaruensis]